MRRSLSFALAGLVIGWCAAPCFAQGPAQGLGRGGAAADAARARAANPQEGARRVSRMADAHRPMTDRGPTADRSRGLARRDERRGASDLGHRPENPGARPAAAPQHDPRQRQLGAGGPAQRIAAHDEALRRQLASIERLRDEAVQTGDVALLDRADHLEREARARHARQAAHFEGQGGPRPGFEVGLGRETARQARGLETFPGFDPEEMVPGAPGFGRLTAQGRGEPRRVPPSTDAGEIPAPDTGALPPTAPGETPTGPIESPAETPLESPVIEPLPTIPTTGGSES